MENETISFWNKKVDDLTVGDSVKFGVVSIAAGVGAAVVFMAGATVTMNLYEKIQNRRRAKLEVVKTEN